MTGSVPKRSIFNHAQPHVRQEMVATFDILEFYPNTKTSNVRSVMERFGFCGSALDAVVMLVIKNDELPQGGPTSGFLANLALEPSDRRIDGLCRKHNLQFTRYVDDIAISGNIDLRSFHDAIAQSVTSCGYTLAPNKTQYMHRHERQIVTKLRVNDKLRPTPEFIFEVKSDIWDCLNNTALSAAIEKGISLTRLKHSLTGKVAHIGQADSKLGIKFKDMLRGVNWTRPNPQSFTSS